MENTKVNWQYGGRLADDFFVPELSFLFLSAFCSDPILTPSRIMQGHTCSLVAVDLAEDVGPGQDP